MLPQVLRLDHLLVNAASSQLIVPSFLNNPGCVKHQYPIRALYTCETVGYHNCGSLVRDCCGRFLIYVSEWESVITTS
jgi:hypothetical protein